jgi:hypothetical protein
MTVSGQFGRAAVHLALSVLAASMVFDTASAETRPVSAKEDVSRLPAGAAQLYLDTTLFPQETKYEEIPWLLDLEEGITLAKREKRPVLIWTSGDDPLERC